MLGVAKSFVHKCLMKRRSVGVLNELLRFKRLSNLMQASSRTKVHHQDVALARRY